MPNEASRKMAQEWAQALSDGIGCDSLLKPCRQCPERVEKWAASLAALLDQRAVAAEAKLAEIEAAQHPCPKCGALISDCYGCRIEKLNARVSALVGALDSIANPQTPDSLGEPLSRLILAQEIARQALFRARGGWG